MTTSNTSIESSSQIEYTKSVHTLRQIYEIYEQDKSLVNNKYTKFYGWIRRIRIGGGGKIVFIDIYDGTKIGSLMCVTSIDQYQGDKYIDHSQLGDLGDATVFKILNFEQLGISNNLSDGCAVCVDGILVLSPYNATQLFELQILRLRVIGGIEDVQTYPIQKSTEKQIVTLRQLPFMRFRSQIMQSIFRICSKLDLAISIFMDKEGVEKVDPNIITMSDCEGAGETFKVSPLIFSKTPEGGDISVGLTVSSQLPLEAAITGFKSVYTAQKSFRAEKSDTSKHLAEFYHIEFEQAFITLDQLMAFTERFVRFIIKFTFTKCQEDFDFIDSKFAPIDIRSSRRMLCDLLDRPFIRIKHHNAITLIQELVANKYYLPDDDGKLKRVKITKIPKQGEDISAEHEKLLIRYFGWVSHTEQEREKLLKEGYEFGSFVFVTHWPLAIKSFYMKQCDDNSGECESFDLLAPRVGELFGGSMREWRHDKLLFEIAKRKMDITPIQWFVDLRKSGSTPHGGWGMGFARLCMLLTGTPSIRDVVPFPVYYTYCPY